MWIHARSTYKDRLLSLQMTPIIVHGEQNSVHSPELALVEREALRCKAHQPLLIHVHPQRIEAGHQHIHPQVILHPHTGTLLCPLFSIVDR